MTTTKPILTGVLLDITNDPTIPIGKYDATYAFNCVLEKKYDELIKYAKTGIVQGNLLRQTPLMLASVLGDIAAVKILGNELGQLDLNGDNALTHATRHCKENIDEIIDMLEPYEFVNLTVAFG